MIEQARALMYAALLKENVKNSEHLLALIHSFYMRFAEAFEVEYPQIPKCVAAVLKKFPVGEKDKDGEYKYRRACYLVETLLIPGIPSIARGKKGFKNGM